MSAEPSPSDALHVTRRWALGVCLLLLLLRLASLSLYPLMDRTESRYGEIGREMVVTADWITPRVLDEPFWGKPPLAAWCTAAGLWAFGPTEFGARLPAYLIGLVTLILVWRLATALGGRSVGRLAAVVFCCSPMTLFLIGGVMTDPYLVFGTTLAWYGPLTWAVREPADRSAWGAALVVAAGLAVATLSKGPIGLVFGLGPLGGLILLREGRDRLRGWPWMRTSILFGLLAAPWFLVAESRTPGFLEYFFVGEHFHRFLDPDWSGDLYGGTHPTPRGIVWLFLPTAMLPWIPAGLSALWHGRARRAWTSSASSPCEVALAVAVLTPLVLFTWAGSVLITYVYPAVPAASILLAFGIHRTAGRSAWLERHTRRMPVVVLAVVTLIVGVLVCVPTRAWLPTSHREIVKSTPERLLVYARNIDFLYSAHFYSDGRAVAAAGPGDPVWERVRGQPERAVVITKWRGMERVPPDLRSRLRLRRDFGGRYQTWTLQGGGLAAEAGAPGLKLPRTRDGAEGGTRTHKGK